MFHEPSVSTRQWVTRGLSLLLLAVGLSTFAEPVEAPAARSVDELLQEVVGSETEGQRCLPVRQLERFEIMNRELLLMHGRADRLWVNKMPRKCAGLRKNMLVSLELFGSQICKNDVFKARDRGLADFGYHTSCRLGTFEAVSAEQVVMLRRSLEN